MSCFCDCMLRRWRRQGNENLDEEPTGPFRRPIEESTASSDTFTIGREGFAIQKDDSGYVLLTPEGAVRDEVDVTVNVRYPDNEAHSLPEGSELVSGVCHMVSKEIELRKNGSLVINHCITIRSAEDGDSLGVVTYKRRGSRGTCNFQYVDDGDILVKSDRTEVKLWKLEPACYGVVCAKERREAVGYCGMLYRLKLEAGLAPSMKFIFVVVKDLNIYIKAVGDHCATRSLEKASEPMPITFEAVQGGQEMKLTLDMKKEGIHNKGWHIYPYAWPAEIRECDAHSYLPTKCHIPSLELQVVWEGSLRPAPGPDRLVEFINIKGTVRPKSLTLQYEPGRPYPQELLGANDPTVPKMSELIKCVGQKKKHNIPEEIGTDYEKFGILLLEDETGTRVRAIEWQCQRQSEAINLEILRQWLEGKGRKIVTWATLIKVLRDISRHTLAEDIEHGLMGRDIFSFLFFIES